MLSATRLNDLTSAVLSSEDDDEILDLLADAVMDMVGLDTLIVLLPLTGSTWVCELARGRFTRELLGTELSRDPGASAVDSRLAFALSQDDRSQLKGLSWRDLARGLTGSLLVPGATEAQDDVLSPDVQPDYEGDEPEVLSFSIDAGAAKTGLLCAVRFSGNDVSAKFDQSEKMTVAAIASLYSFALNGSTGRSAIEDDLRDERNRIARDLHDLAIQELFGVGMQLEVIQQEATKFSEFSSDGPVAKSIHESVTGIERSISEIRAIVQSLRNESNDVTLSQRLRHECGIAIAGLGFVPNLQFHAPTSDIDAIDGELEEDVVAVVKECLANVARHARASAVAVNVSIFREGVDRVVQVNVSDNGHGIDPAVTRRSGLANMKSRARRHMGWVDFYSLDPGTMVSWRATIFTE